MRKAVSFFLAVGIGWSCASAAEAAEAVPAASEAYVVIDAKTGQILLEKNAGKREQPASLTKIMTAGLGARDGDPDGTVVASDAAVEDIWRWGESTHLGMEPGEAVSLRDALYGTMVESANDCANLVAEKIGGTLAGFADLMNGQAEALGLTGTHFCNAHGLPEKNHYTTAYDMAMITRWALAVPGFEEYFCATVHTIPKTNKKNTERIIRTHHHMIAQSEYHYEGAVGGKLGWSTESNHTIVTWARRGQLSLIAVCLNCRDKWEKYRDTARLFDYCFDRYDMVTVSPDRIASYDVPLGSRQRPSGIVHISMPEELDILVKKGVDTRGIGFTYDNIPACYRRGKTISPAVRVYSNGTEVARVPMRFTVEIFPKEPDGESGGAVPHPWIPAALTLLRRIGAVLLSLAVLLFLLRAFLLRRRKRRRKALLEKRAREQEKRREDRKGIGPR